MDASFLRAVYHHEWLLTNGIGGYALGLGNLLNERKYNGLLIAGLPNFERLHVLSGLEEMIEWRGHEFNIDANHYPDCIYPQGYEHIVKAWIRPHVSVLYSSYPADRETLLLKEIMMPPGMNAVVVRYRNLGAYPLNLTVRPKFTMRNHHVVLPQGDWDRIETRIDCQETSFSLTRADQPFRADFQVDSGAIKRTGVIYRQTYYPYEAARGYEAVEDLFSPAEWRFGLRTGEEAGFVCSLVWSDEPMIDAANAATAAKNAYAHYPLPADHPDKIMPSGANWAELIRTDEPVFNRKEYLAVLGQAAADFLTDDDIIAGYPWFGPWGRDTLICLPALKRLSGGSRLAKRILKKYGRSIKNGLIPNIFGEGGEGLNYETVDAPLWYVLGCWEFGLTDKELLRRASAVVLNYLNNPDLHFFTDDDGLVSIHPGPYALTWMDAKIYDQPVTPRFGKPIEINALWYNALMALSEMAKAGGLSGDDQLASRPYSITVKELDRLAAKVKRSLAAFAGPDFLADRIDSEGPVHVIRPNAIVAMGLPFGWLNKKDMNRYLDVAVNKLLTEKGVRSLDPDHPAFKKRYIGNHKQRDLAYHQGTSWGWLLGSLAKAKVNAASKVKPGSAGAKKLARELGGYVRRFRTAFQKNHIASVAEIWDGSEPNFPKGCPAQAWSVMAVLEIEMMVEELEGR